MAIIKYKGTVIKGYSGDFILKGNPELIKLAYDTGLGSKNSQGFGCIEVMWKANFCFSHFFCNEWFKILSYNYIKTIYRKILLYDKILHISLKEIKFFCRSIK